jgi:hypothetical protein
MAPNIKSVEMARIGSKMKRPRTIMISKEKSEIRIADVPSIPRVTVFTPVVRANSNSCEDFVRTFRSGSWIARVKSLLESDAALKLK